MGPAQAGRGLGTGQGGRERASAAFTLRLCVRKSTKKFPTPISTCTGRGAFWGAS